MRRRRKGRLLAHVLVALLPLSLKLLCYRRLFGFRIGRGVRVGLSVLDVDRCTLSDGACIGHGNVVTRVGELWMGAHARVGFGNLLRGADRMRLGAYSEILRLNRINAIPDAECIARPQPEFVLGDGSVVTNEHRIDCTDRVEIGRFTVIAGRNSSFWTHARQATRPVRIGSFAYVGSEVRFAPGGAIPSWSILGLGSVVIDPITDEGCLIAGVPARVIRPLSDEDAAMITRKTRRDIPDAWYADVVAKWPSAPALPG